MKKCFALFLVLTISLFTLGGCASRDDAAANGPPDPSTSVTDPAENNEPNEETQNLPGEEDPSVSDDPGMNTEHLVAEGIVLMSVETTGSGKKVQLTCINPETGDQEDFLSFSVSSPYEIAAMPIMWAAMPLFEGSMCGRFSSDFTKIAATRSLTDSTEKHAGWIDATGNFFDVTVALGLEARSNFADPPAYEAIGFTPNDELVYVDWGQSSGVFYAVPMDNLSLENVKELGTWEAMAVAFGAPANMGPVLHSAWDEKNQFVISDQIDDAHYIATFGESYNEGAKPKSAIVAFGSDNSFSREEYTPEASRYTWSGKLSPDGAQIAFLSCSSEATYNDKPTELFIGSVDGDEPIKVPCELPDTEYHMRTNGIYNMADEEISDAHCYCAIVGWE